ncbi:MAG: hypothetical protein ACK5LO_15000 [Leucobacter sp.]
MSYSWYQVSRAAHLCYDVEQQMGSSSTSSSSRAWRGFRLPAIISAAALVVSGVALGPAAYAEDELSSAPLAQQETEAIDEFVVEQGEDLEFAAEDDVTEIPSPGEGDSTPPQADETDAPGASEPLAAVPAPAEAPTQPEGPAAAAPAPPTAAAGATRNESEPNNNRNQANSLPLGDTMRGTISNNTDQDYFRLNVPQAGRTKIQFTFPNSVSGNAYYLRIQDANGKNYFSFDLTGSDADGTRVADFATFLPAGQAFVQVDAGSGWSSIGKQYALRVDVTPGTVETEFNDNRATADPLTLGQTIRGAITNNTDQDYYVLNSSKSTSGVLSFKFPASVSGNAYYVRVLNASGQTLHSFDLNSSHADGSWLMKQSVSLPAGQFFVQVDAGSGWSSIGKEYSLSVGQKLPAATPTIGGSKTFGKTLTAKPGDWGSGVSFTYQWKRNGSSIKGATAAKYKLTTKDVGRQITVTVTGSKTGYVSTSKTSAKTKSIARAKITPATPKISGTAKVGSKLTAKPGTWNPTSVKLKYQWKLNGKNIKGATKTTYALKKSDAGKKITVKVTGSKPGYQAVSSTSKSKTVRK